MGYPKSINSCLSFSLSLSLSLSLLLSFPCPLLLVMGLLCGFYSNLTLFMFIITKLEMFLFFHSLSASHIYPRHANWLTHIFLFPLFLFLSLSLSLVLFFSVHPFLASTGRISLLLWQKLGTCINFRSNGNF